MRSRWGLFVEQHRLRRRLLHAEDGEAPHAEEDDAMAGHIISTTISGKNGEPKHVSRASRPSHVLQAFTRLFAASSASDPNPFPVFGMPWERKSWFYGGCPVPFFLFLESNNHILPLCFLVRFVSHHLSTLANSYLIIFLLQRGPSVNASFSSPPGLSG